VVRPATPALAVSAYYNYHYTVDGDGVPDDDDVLLLSHGHPRWSYADGTDARNEAPAG
jgi:hypothetical protein